MADEKITVENRSPINVTVSSSGVQGPPPLPNEVTVPLSPSQPVVPEFGTTNIWSVSGTNVPLVLPNKPNGFQALVHITGLANIVWPGSTVVRGATTASTVWATITKTSNRWEVLIPSDEPLPVESMRDSGLHPVIAGASVGGAITWGSGNATLFSQHFAPFAGPKSTIALNFRRIGNQVTGCIIGFQRTAATPAPGSLVMISAAPDIIPSWCRPPATYTFAVPMATTAAQAPVFDTAYVSVTTSGSIYVAGMSEGNLLGHSYNGTSDLGSVTMNWPSVSPWPVA